LNIQAFNTFILQLYYLLLQISRQNILDGLMILFQDNSSVNELDLVFYIMELLSQL